MNRIRKVFLFALILTFPLLHAAQANQQVAQDNQQIVAKIKPLHHVTKEYIFFIHPNQINIYPKTPDILEAFNIDKFEVSDYELGIMEGVISFKAESTFEKEHADIKLTGEAHKTALLQLNSSILIELLNRKKCFLNSCKEIICNNNLDIEKVDLNVDAIFDQNGNNSRPDTVIHGLGHFVWYYPTHPWIAKRLLALGADINKPYKYTGETALIAAVRFFHNPLVKILLFAGADTKLKETRWGKTAAYFAKQKPAMKQIFDEFYDTRDVLRMNLPHKIVLAYVGNITGISKEIAEYLIGKRVKVEAFKSTKQIGKSS